MKEFAINKLKRLGVNPNVLKRYDEEHRLYHNWEHIENLLESAYSKEWLKRNDGLFLAIIFHDIIYDPKINNNEELSAELFSKSYNGNFKEIITQAILDTKTHIPINEISKKLCELDLEILNSDLTGLIEFENKIRQEYSFVEDSIYKEKRIEVLRSLQKKDELEELIKYINNQ